MAPCTMATLMSNHSPPPMSLSLAPLALVSPIHGPRRNGGVDGENDGKDDRQSGMCLRVCVIACLLIVQQHLQLHKLQQPAVPHPRRGRGGGGRRPLPPPLKMGAE